MVSSIGKFSPDPYGEGVMKIGLSFKKVINLHLRRLIPTQVDFLNEHGSLNPVSVCGPLAAAHHRTSFAKAIGGN